MIHPSATAEARPASPPRRSGCSIGTLALICLLWPIGARADLGDDLKRASNQLELLENKALLIEQEYLRLQGRTSSGRKFEERLNDGQALMLLKDYVRAAIVFHNLVEDELAHRHPGYADALYNLGESLFFNKNYIDARKYYRRVLKDDRGRPYRKLALIRLMQIALRIKQFEQVDTYHDHIRAEGGDYSPESEYLWGKTLFARDRYDQAFGAFASLSPGQTFFPQARYFLGVIEVRRKRYEDALRLFSDLVAVKPKSSKEAEVIELAHLARGRLLYDLGQEPGALDALQAIEHTSPHFDEALFEICWTYIQRAEKAEQTDDRQRWFLEAYRTIEILQVSTPDSTFVPRAHLLKGSILERMGKFEEAAEVFSKVSSKYVVVRAELDELIASHDNPVQYFNEVAGRNLDTFDLTSYLPAVAVRWMSRQEEMTAALGVMKDLEKGRRFIKEARDLLDKLDELLADKQDRINLFPLLLDGAKRSIEVENARVILERNLGALEERVVMEYLSAAERNQLQSARQQRELLEKKLEGMPTSKNATDEREARLRQKIEAMEQAVYQSSIGLQGMKAQLTAMEEWIRQNAAKLRGREEAVRDFREEIRRGWAMANQLQMELDVLANQLATEKARAGMSAEAQTKEDELRKRYQAALATERALAEQIHDRLGVEGTGQVSWINNLRLRSDKLGKSLRTIRQGLDQRVGVEARRLEAEAAQERKNLETFEAAIGKLEQESENLAGEVAFRALEEVRQRFYSLVLEADVGVLDVAWSRKMETTDKISDLTRKQGAERKRLHEEFKGVLKEVN